MYVQFTPTVYLSDTPAMCCLQIDCTYECIYILLLQTISYLSSDHLALLDDDANVKLCHTL